MTTDSPKRIITETSETLPRRHGNFRGTDQQSTHQICGGGGKQAQDLSGLEGNQRCCVGGSRTSGEELFDGLMVKRKYARRGNVFAASETLHGRIENHRTAEVDDVWLYSAANTRADPRKGGRFKQPGDRPNLNMLAQGWVKTFPIGESTHGNNVQSAGGLEEPIGFLREVIRI